MKMPDDDVKQRVQYLVEHGGVYDDPLADIRRLARWAIGVSSVALVLGVIDLFT